MKSSILKSLLALALALFSAGPFAVFDPVNDDTDLFRNNPNIPSERPNVLIILDNTANWGGTNTSSPFVNEKPALVSVVNGLDDSYNVGLMMFPETGGSNDSIDGAYVRFAMRRMDTTNKSALSSLVGGLHAGNDKGNNSTLSLAMHEAYLYFKGAASRASFGKVKTDFAGNTTGNPIAEPLGSHALPANPTSSSLYNSAVGVACAKSYIIYISNGPANENASALSTAQDLLSAAMGLGGAAPPVISITPDGQQNNWADEYAKFMAGNDVNSTLTGSQFVTTYTVEVDPGTQNADLAMTALMKSMAINGNGKYFAVTSSGGAASTIVTALKAIFSEIQAVNSVFAASTLPVSVNVRGTNLNQLYIGVFRPDSGDLPRWLGNLKAYQLKKDSATGAVFTVDAGSVAAINSTTGFITSSASSFWTSSTQIPTNYWSFRPSAQNGVGGSSDKPDGDLVEKGGAAQQVRSTYFAIGVNDVTTPRPLYTCTQGSTFPVCAPGALLSATPFSTANTDITAAALNLNTHSVTPLTAAVTKTVSALADTRPLTLTNALGAVPVTGISTNNVVRSVSSLDSSTVINVSAMSNGATSTSITSISVANGSNKVATVTLASAVSLSAGQTVVLTGTTGFDGTHSVTSVTSSTVFKFGSFTGAIDVTGGSMTLSNTTVNATTATNHPFIVGEQVTIAGVTPSNFTTGTKTITAVGANTFSWGNEAVSTAPVLSSATATGRGTTVLATTSAAHGFVAGQSVTVAGASPTGYNGVYSIITVPSTTTFTYVMGTTQTAAATGTITATAGGTTATATLPANAFVNGASVTIAGASPAGYNGTFTISGATGTSFQYTVTAGLGSATGTITASDPTTTTSTVTATLAAHGFTAGQSITIGGVSTAGFNGAWDVATFVDTSTFTFSTGSALGSPAGTPTVRKTSSPLAYATITGHGYSGTPSVTIAGAAPSGYNGTYPATVIDADTISYVLSSAQGANTGSSMTASTPTTTATGTSTAHGFADGQVVTIGGATPTAFNGTFNITFVDADRFQYTLLSPQLSASGTITAVSSGAGVSQANLIVDWIRGMDNYQDENANSSFGDTRASIHGDVLHSRPAVVNYNRRTDTGNIDNDVYIYYGGNDGVFRALKGGFGSSTGDPAPGAEVWGFVAPEFFPSLSRLRVNSPAISANFKRPYFFDGPIGVFTLDKNGDGKLDVSGTPDPTSTTQDKVWLFMGMRRGGRFMYALDVSQPLSPRLLWRKGCPSLDPVLAGACDLGWEELGQTWSQPVVIPSIFATTDPVLMFGAGYDPLVEDVDPATITSNTAASVVSTGGTFNRSMGRGIYVVNARTGALIWQARGQARSGSLAPIPGTPPVKVVPGMDFAIPSDIAVVVGDTTLTKPFRAYVGDMGGQMWRIDFGDASPANWTVVKLASIADQTVSSGRRKFMFAPEVIGAPGFDAVVSGSGDREHPFDTTITNRVYMFKDKISSTTPPVSGSTALQAPITEGTGSGDPMLNVTSNCIQVLANCTGTAPQAAGGGFTAPQNTANALNANTNFGWYITLLSGEKQIGGTVGTAGTLLFATNQPSASAGGGACSPNLGVARQYSVSFLDGTAFSGTSLSTTYAGGGYLPSPVLVYVGLGGTSGTGNVTGGGVSVGGDITGSQLKVGAGAATGGGNDPTGVVCFGASCALAPGVQLYARLRKFWYKEID